MNRLKKLHKDLLYYRFCYYIKSESVVTDYQYDMLEREYDSLCEEYNIPAHKRITNYVGYNNEIIENL